MLIAHFNTCIPFYNLKISAKSKNTAKLPSTFKGAVGLIGVASRYFICSRTCQFILPQSGESRCSLYHCLHFCITLKVLDIAVLDFQAIIVDIDRHNAAAEAVFDITVLAMVQVAFPAIISIVIKACVLLIFLRCVGTVIDRIIIIIYTTHGKKGQCILMSSGLFQADDNHHLFAARIVVVIVSDGNRLNICIGNRYTASGVICLIKILCRLSRLGLKRSSIVFKLIDTAIDE